MKSLLLAIFLAATSLSASQTTSDSKSSTAPLLEPTKFFTSLRESFHDCSTRCNCVGCVSCLGVTIYQFQANDKDAPPIYWCRPGLEDSQDDLQIGKVVYKALLRDKLPKAVRSVFPPTLKKLPGMSARLSHHHNQMPGSRSRRSTDLDHVSTVEQGSMMQQDQGQPQGPEFDPLDPSKNQFGQATHQVTVPNVVVQPGFSQGTENKQASLLRMPVSAEEVKKVTGSDPTLSNTGLRQGAPEETSAVDANNSATNISGQPPQGAGQQEGQQQPSELQNVNQTDQQQQLPGGDQPTQQGQQQHQNLNQQQTGSQPQPPVEQQQPNQGPQQNFNLTAPEQPLTFQQQTAAQQQTGTQPSFDQLRLQQNQLQQQVQQQQNQLQQQKTVLEQQLHQQQHQLQQQKSTAEQQLANQFLTVQQQAQNLRNQAFHQHQNLQQLQQQETLLQQQNFHQQNNAVLQQQSLQQQNNVQQKQNLQQQQQNLEQQQGALQQGQQGPSSGLRTDVSSVQTFTSPVELANQTSQLPPSLAPPPTQDQIQLNETTVPEQTLFGQNNTLTSQPETNDTISLFPPDQSFNSTSSSKTPSTSVSGSASSSTSPSGVRVSGFVSSSNQSSPLIPVNTTLPISPEPATATTTDPSAPVLSNVTLTTSNGNVTIDIQSAGTPTSTSSSVPPTPEETSAPTSAPTSDLTNTSATPSNETGSAVITRPTDQDSMTIVVVAPSKVLTLVQGKNIAVEVMNEPIQNCSQDTQSDAVSNQKRIELLKSAITALQFTLTKLEQESPLESVQVLLTSRCQGANGTSTPQMAGEPASIKITPNPQLPPGQVRIDVQTATQQEDQEQKEPMTNFQPSPCSTMDIERYKTEMSTAVYAMYQNEPTLFVFIKDAKCVGVFRQSKENSILPASSLFPEFPWNDNFVKASVYYNDVLYIFDASAPQRVWTFEFDPQRSNFKVTSQGVISLDEFARSGCLIPNFPTGFRVHAAAQATTAEPSCVLFDEHMTPITTPTPEARGLATAISKVANLQFLQSIKALFTWHDQISPSNYYVFGSNDELYRVFRGTRGGSSWRTSTHVLVPYEKYPY